MKWGVEPIGDETGQAGFEAIGKPGEGLNSRAWDEDFAEADDSASTMTDEDRASMRRYYKDHP